MDDKRAGGCLAGPPPSHGCALGSTGSHWSFQPGQDRPMRKLLYGDFPPSRSAAVCAVACADPATPVLKRLQREVVQNHPWAGTGLGRSSSPCRSYRSYFGQNVKYLFRGMLYAVIKKAEIAMSSLHRLGRAAAQHCRFYPVQTHLFI